MIERKGMSMDLIKLSQKSPFSISPRHTFQMIESKDRAIGGGVNL